ncbi:TPA: molybdenum cofactor guanylyltransferase [Candidatus Poribacteria bacterium]|nr:molybdenum cofactor guanylyltransferase [Candidatus Poribacteria bacterium]HEX30528.1 molybdenum cofactor guanylyltransferase [Candidatus Poribacteria bacterium]
MTELNVSAIVLAGGRSSRFKRDKALILWEGKPLIVRLVDMLKRMFGEIIVVTGDDRRYEDLLDVIVVDDLIKGKGPLGGIHAGLSSSSNDYNLILPCDMPLLNEKVISLLLDEIDGRSRIILPVVRGYVEPLVGIYHRDCIPFAEMLLRGGKLKVLGLVDFVPTKLIPENRVLEVDPNLTSFLNLNSPEDLKIATCGLIEEVIKEE